jgi:predicted DNA-binding ribbon-helix-helix protein
MSDTIKSGKEVIDEFFSEIYNIANADKLTVDAVVALYDKNKLTDTNLQNALDTLLQKELDKIEKDEDED